MDFSLMLDLFWRSRGGTSIVALGGSWITLELPNGADLASKSLSREAISARDRFWHRFWIHFGSLLAPYWDHFGSLLDLRPLKNEFWGASKSQELKNTLWRGFRDRFSIDFGCVLEPFSERMLGIVGCCTFTMRVFKNTALFRRNPHGTRVFAIPKDAQNFLICLKKN